MEDKNVFMSVSRHGNYIGATNYPINNHSIVDIFFRTKEVCEKYGKIDCVYTSTAARAVVSGGVVAKSSGVLSENIFKDSRITEYARLEKILDLIDEAKNHAKENGFNHIHIVTHLPVLSRFGFSFANTSEFLVFESEKWEDMSISKDSLIYQISKIADEKKEKYISAISDVDFSGDPFGEIEEIYNR